MKKFVFAFFVIAPAMSFGADSVRLVNIYPGKSGGLYIPSGGVIKDGNQLKIKFVAKPNKGTTSVYYGMDVDCSNGLGMMTSAESVQGQGEPVPLMLNPAAEQIKKIVGRYPTDKDILGGICEGFK